LIMNTIIRNQCYYLHTIFYITHNIIKLYINLYNNTVYRILMLHTINYFLILKIVHR